MDYSVAYTIKNVSNIQLTIRALSLKEVTRYSQSDEGLFDEEKEKHVEIEVQLKLIHDELMKAALPQSMRGPLRGDDLDSAAIRCTTSFRYTDFQEFVTGLEQSILQKPSPNAQSVNTLIRSELLRSEYFASLEIQRLSVFESANEEYDVNFSFSRLEFHNTYSQEEMTHLYNELIKSWRTLLSDDKSQQGASSDMQTPLSIEQNVVDFSFFDTQSNSRERIWLLYKDVVKQLLDQINRQVLDNFALPKENLQLYEEHKSWARPPYLFLQIPNTIYPSSSLPYYLGVCLSSDPSKLRIFASSGDVRCPIYKVWDFEPSNLAANLQTAVGWWIDNDIIMLMDVFKAGNRRKT